MLITFEGACNFLFYIIESLCQLILTDWWLAKLVKMFHRFGCNGCVYVCIPVDVVMLFTDLVGVIQALMWYFVALAIGFYLDIDAMLFFCPLF